ncbi:alkaline phosphatase family protein [Lentisalinibacter salinarum]|uniref:alkaline phosphatase family protein n=1 Tax=Lentisalinibacter salinarum TaxID=2992239 RepID=UPI00386A8932
MRLAALLAVALIVLVAGCATSPDRSADGGPGAGTEPPQLLVLVVLDQFGDWVLAEHLPLLPPDSLLRRAWAEGARHSVDLRYANTATAAGHATLVTGVAPAVHGAFANAVHHPVRGRLPIVDDGVHRVIGNPESHASPAALRVETAGDRLHEATGGEAVIVGVSMKARAAILATGRSADLAVFYDDDIPAMTTSAWYRPDGSLPDWLAAFNADQPVERTFTTWQRRADSPCAQDDAPGEGPFVGWNNVFPYAPADSQKPDKAFGYSAASTPWFFAAARAAIGAEGMGEDDVPDLLVLGVSGTDRIGHVWGATSCEYVDNLLRTDRELTALARSLPDEMRVTFVITADHGVARLPEQTGEPGGRLPSETIIATAREAARAALGEGDWIAGYQSSSLYFTASGDARGAELSAAVAAALADLPGIERVYAFRDRAALAASASAIDRLAAASMPEGVDADLLVVPATGWFNAVYDVPGGGANHGTPWDYDRRVPVLMWGHGIERVASDEVADARRVAATLTAILGVSAPEGAVQPPLAGVEVGAAR